MSNKNNIKNTIDKLSKEQLEDVCKKCNNKADVLRHIGYTVVNGRNTDTLTYYIEKYNIDISHFSRRCNHKTIRNRENVFCKNSTASQRTLRKFYLREDFEYKCDICGINSWNNKKITLFLDHKNGINNDNRLENLHWVCPNCDSQQETFGFRGVKKINKINKKY